MSNINLLSLVLMSLTVAYLWWELTREREKINAELSHLKDDGGRHLLKINDAMGLIDKIQAWKDEHKVSSTKDAIALAKKLNTDASNSVNHATRLLHEAQLRLDDYEADAETDAETYDESSEEPSDNPYVEQIKIAENEVDNLTRELDRMTDLADRVSRRTRLLRTLKRRSIVWKHLCTEAEIWLSINMAKHGLAEIRDQLRKRVAELHEAIDELQE